MPGTGAVDEIWVDVGANIAPLEKGMARAEAVTDATAKKMQESATKASRSTSTLLGQTARDWEKSAARMRTAGRSITRYVTLPLLGVGAAAVKMNVDFEREMKKVQTQAGASAAQLKTLTKAALELSTRGTQGPKDIAKAMYHAQSLLTGMSNSTAKAIRLVRTAVDANAVSGANLEDIVSALGAAVRTGIKGAQNMNEAMGLLNGTIGAGNMQMQDLLSALSTGILPAAKTAGIGLKDVGAALALMADEGMPAQEASTRLRMTLALMAAPTHQAANALDRIGLGSLSLGHALQEPNGLLKALELLKSHLQAFSSDPVKQEQILVRAFGGGRSSAAIMLLLNNLDVLKVKYGQVGKSAKNFANDVAESHQTAAYKIQHAWAQVRTSLTQFGGQIAPYVADSAAAVAKLVEGFSELPGPVKTALALIAGGFAVGGPILLGVSSLVRALKTIAPAMFAAGTTGGQELAAGVAAGATEAETSIAGVRMALLGLGGLALAPIVIPIAYEVVKSGVIPKALQAAAKKAGIPVGGGASKKNPATYQDYMRLYNSSATGPEIAKALLQASGVSSPYQLPGAPTSAANGDTAAKVAHAKAATAAAAAAYKMRGQYTQGKTGRITVGMRAAEMVAASFGLGVNNDYATGGHAKNSYHYTGQAADFHLVGNGMHDKKGRAYWNFLTANAQDYKELISPYGIYLNGQQMVRGVNMSKSAYDKLLAQHSGANAHIHVAFTGTSMKQAQELVAWQQGHTDMTSDSMTTPGTNTKRKTIGLATKGLSKEQQTNAKLIYAWALHNGLTPEQALDMVAASKAESGLRTHALGPQTKQGKATGIFQLLSKGYIEKARKFAQQNKLAGGVNNPLAQLYAIGGDYLSYYKNHPGPVVKGAAASAVEKSGMSAAWYAAHGYSGLSLKKGGFLPSDLGSNAVKTQTLKLASQVAVNGAKATFEKQLREIARMANGPLKSRLLAAEKKIGSGLSDNLITPAQLAGLKTKLSTVTKLIKNAITAAQKVITADKSRFEGAVNDLMDRVNAAFQAKVEQGLKKLHATVTMPDGSTFDYTEDPNSPNAGMTPASQAMKVYDKQTSQMDAVRQLWAAYVQKYQYDAIGMPVQTADYQDAMASYNDALHQQQVAGVSDNADLQKFAQENNLQIVKDANGKMLDLVDSSRNILLQLTMSGLQDQADAEQQAATNALTTAQLNYQSQQDLLQQNMDAQIAILEQGVENGTITAQQFQDGVSRAMTDAGLSVATFAGLMGTSFGTQFSDLLSTAIGWVNKLADAYRHLDDVQGTAHAIDNSVPQSAMDYINSLPQVTPGQLAGMSFGEIASNIASEMAHIGANLTPIKMATGGIVRARSGGILANLGEGKYDEAVLPLSPSLLSQIGGAGGGSSTASGDLNITVTVPGVLVGSGGMAELAELVRQQFQELANRGATLPS